MSYRELVPLADHGISQMRIGALTTDLTLIYGPHATTDDAHNSTLHVEPDSLVYLEGYSSDEAVEPLFQNALRVLRSLRLRQGTQSDDYKYLKSAILTDVDSGLATYEPQSPTDFTLFQLAEVGDLVAKDCVVDYADHQTESIRKRDAQLSGNINERLQNAARGDAILPVMDIGPHEGLGRTIASVTKAVKDYTFAQTVRELQASGLVLYQNQYILTHADTSSLRKHNGVQLATYMIYGWAHARSLTAHFQQEGATPRVIEPGTLREHEYLDYAQAPDYNNFARRVGHAMFRYLSLLFVNEQYREEIVASAYDSLAFLNETDEETCDRFLITCASIAREANRDPERSYRWFESFLLDCVPAVREVFKVNPDRLIVL